MTLNNSKIHFILLAAGDSLRFSSNTNKLLAKFKNKNLLTHNIDFLKELKSHCETNEPADVDDLNQKFKQPLLDIIQKIGENIKIAYLGKIQGDGGFVYSYVHTDGKLAALVKLSQENEALGKDVAMQIAANNPLAISSDLINEDLLEKEKEISLANLEHEKKHYEIK